MGAKILTGYTGEKHITPLDDAAVYRSIDGSDSYVLAEGDMCKAEMPSINEFTIYSGLISLQGIQARITRETLSVDTCPTGKARIDLVVARYTHDNSSKIDNIELTILKGAEVDDSNDPIPPAYNTGSIDAGATAVDMPLYEITLLGASVTFEKIHKRAFSNEQIRPLEIHFTAVSSLPQTVLDSRIFEEHKVKPHDCLLSSQASQTSDWEVTTVDGAVTLSGNISGATDITLWLTLPID